MSPLKGPTRFGVTPPSETPYHRAGQEWDERLGSSRVQAANWRWMALGLLTLSGGLAAGLVGLSLRGDVTPWVVQVDRFGEPRVVAPAAQGARPTDPMIAWTLSRFIGDIRAVSTDPVLMRQAWLRAYDFTDAAGAAVLSDYARRADPFAEVGRVQVVVSVSSVVRASPDSFRLAWTEQRYAEGQLVATERWTAILTLTIKPPRTAEALRTNPLGIFIRSISWSKEFGA